mmetsp:Transcript_22509/g.42934  ORF Transcript_22509/g.42934 Transcript_22509/m.42934 type:complete len:303 (-) Transcript_22509:361-1269(-)
MGFVGGKEPGGTTSSGSPPHSEFRHCGGGCEDRSHLAGVPEGQMCKSQPRHAPEARAAPNSHRQEAPGDSAAAPAHGLLLRRRRSPRHRPSHARQVLHLRGRRAARRALGPGLGRQGGPCVCGLGGGGSRHRRAARQGRGLCGAGVRHAAAHGRHRRLHAGGDQRAGRAAGAGHPSGQDALARRARGHHLHAHPSHPRLRLPHPQAHGNLLGALVAAEAQPDQGASDSEEAAGGAVGSPVAEWPRRSSTAIGGAQQLRFKGKGAWCKETGEGGEGASQLASFREHLGCVNSCLETIWGWRRP